jgi:hypothetical protein
MGIGMDMGMPYGTAIYDCCGIMEEEEEEDE